MPADFSIDPVGKQVESRIQEKMKSGNQRPGAVELTCTRSKPYCNCGNRVKNDG